VVGGPNPNSGNFNPSSSIGGRVAVFGNFTGNGSQIGSQGYNLVSEHYTLVVNGSVLTNPFTVGNGSTSTAVYVKGSHPAFNTPQLTLNDVPVDFDFTSARNSLQSLSMRGFSSGATTPTVSDNGTNYYVSVNGGSGIQIYNVNASYFTNQNRGFEVDLNNTAASVVINVINAGSILNIQKGTAVKVNGTPVAYNTSAGDPVLFNFSTVTSLNIANGDFAGTLLAPFASFTSTHGFMVN